MESKVRSLLSEENINQNWLLVRWKFWVNDLVIYSEAQTPPFEIKDGITTNESPVKAPVDLRRPSSAKIIYAL